MFKKDIITNIFIFIFGLFIGLYINIDMLSLNDFETSSKETLKIPLEEKTSTTPIKVLKEEKKVDIISFESKDIQKEDINYLEIFKKYLQEEKYENALSIYENKSNNDTIYKYKNTLFNFIETNLSKKTNSIKKLINLYLTYEYDNPFALFYKAQITYNEQKYFDAIKELYEIKKSSIHEELEKHINLKLTLYIQNYQKLLISQDNREATKNLLIYLLEKDSSNSSYKFALAEYYFHIQYYEKAKELLESILDVEVYKNSVVEYLEKIDKILKLQNKFTHKIKLEKQDNHFFIKVIIDNKKLKLMIDTGATYTLINESKYSDYEKTRPIILNTANGQKEAFIIKVKDFQLDNIKVENFEVTISEFLGNNFDGLLGMNFFREFDFYIDQESSVLYLK